MSIPAQPEGRLWGGRFSKPPSEALMALSRSEPGAFDLAPYDLAASIAHAHQLERSGVLRSEDVGRLAAAIDALASEYLDGTIHPLPGDEDVHGFLERELIARVGPLGGALRAGRSRNDQAVNDLRLYLRDHARVVHDHLLDLLTALLDQASRHRRTLAPGFTHLQPAQPIVFAHHLLAHCCALWRDVERLRDWDVRASESPLGAAALGGSPLVEDPAAAAAELGYERSFSNSVDAVAARDVVCEMLFVAAMIAVDVSRLADEVILWVSAQFAWATLDEGLSTGSSIMPQKQNPDVAELARGRAARLVGDLSAMLGAVKGLPLAYNRDLSEDKHASMDAVTSLETVLPAMARLVGTLTFDEERLRRDATARFTLATEVADWLVERGVPFHEAHEVTGRLVHRCEAMGRTLESLDETDARLLSGVDPRLSVDVLARLSPEIAIDRRNAPGATAFPRVNEQIEVFTHRISAARAWSNAYRGPRPR